MTSLEKLIQQNPIEISYPCMYPTYNDFMTNIPTKTLVTFYDVCLGIYSYYLSFIALCDAANKHYEEQQDLAYLDKQNKLEKANYMKRQVRAMRAHIAEFNRNYSSYREERTSQLGKYRIRNTHTTIHNRNIERHWK